MAEHLDQDDQQDHIPSTGKGHKSTACLKSPPDQYDTARDYAIEKTTTYMARSHGVGTCEVLLGGRYKLKESLHNPRIHLLSRSLFASSENISQHIISMHSMAHTFNPAWHTCSVHVMWNFLFWNHESHAIVINMRPLASSHLCWFYYPPGLKRPKAKNQ